MEPSGNPLQEFAVKFAEELKALCIELINRPTSPYDKRLGSFNAKRLFLRAWRHFLAFELLISHNLKIDAATALRSFLETAICFNANRYNPESLADALKADQLTSINSNIKRYRNKLPPEDLNLLEKLKQSLLDDGVSPARIKWDSLARMGNCEWLYEEHKLLSSVYAHISELSLFYSTPAIDGVLSKHMQHFFYDESIAQPLTLTGCLIDMADSYCRIHLFGSYYDRLAALDEKHKWLVARSLELNPSFDDAEVKP